MRARFAVWIFDNVPLPGWAAPYVFGAIIGRWPHRNRASQEGLSGSFLPQTGDMTSEPGGALEPGEIPQHKGGGE